MKQHYNTDFNIKNVNEKVTLYGWVQKKRDFKSPHQIFCKKGLLFYKKGV